MCKECGCRSVSSLGGENCNNYWGQVIEKKKNQRKKKRVFEASVPVVNDLSLLSTLATLVSKGKLNGVKK
jgi:hypothetical protein